MYTVLARKYRPQKINEIKGQDVATTIIKNAILKNKLHHALLLSGPMGTGKTSLARIIAKSLNCKNGPTIDPCNKCESCISITKGKSVDVIEIDGASNRKIENARSIIESIKYPPLSSRYKVYIVDEVHMLTQEAFNALLKTIEEPPDYVKFIFATTALNKVPDTIQSRCQILSLKKVHKEIIAEKLKIISEKEKVAVDADAVDMIARFADGSFRVAEGYLDRCISYKNDNITPEDVEKVIGIAGSEQIKKYLSFIKEKKISSALSMIDNLFNNGINAEFFVQSIINHLLSNDFNLEYKTALLNVYYNVLVDIKHQMDEKIALEIATHKAVSIGDLEKVEKLIEYLSENESSQTASDSRMAENDTYINTSSIKKDIKADIKKNSMLDFVLKEFEGKIISTEDIKK